MNRTVTPLTTLVSFTTREILKTARENLPNLLGNTSIVFGEIITDHVTPLLASIFTQAEQIESFYRTENSNLRRNNSELKTQCSYLKERIKFLEKEFGIVSEERDALLDPTEKKS